MLPPPKDHELPPLLALVAANAPVIATPLAAARTLIAVPLPNDVILGRGVPIAKYEGNVRFRDLIRTHKDAYMALYSASKRKPLAAYLLPFKFRGARPVKKRPKARSSRLFVSEMPTRARMLCSKTPPSGRCPVVGGAPVEHPSRLHNVPSRWLLL
jgi:hypothetical protein